MVRRAFHAKREPKKHCGYDKASVSDYSVEGRVIEKLDDKEQYICVDHRIKEVDVKKGIWVWKGSFI